MISFCGISQKSKEDKIPRKTVRSIPMLTAYLTEGVTEKSEKVEAIYTWITENIEYDYAQIEQDDYFTGVDPRTVLKSKKGICSGYVELMKAMLDVAGIPAETVNGYTRNVSWSPGQLVMTETHAWIAYKIKGEWYLADPTWDAGYIGRIPIEPYTPKEYRKNEFRNSARESRVLTKRQEKEEKRKADFEEKPKYSKKIGFVRDPVLDHLNMHTDTFLLTHLPINPIWQLRSNIISIEEFSTTPDTIAMHLANTGGLTIDYLEEIKAYRDEDYLHQLLINGEDGYDYNKYNPSTKALNYYNFMALINSKNLQKLARGSQYEITPAKYGYLSALNDTVIKYVKLFKTFEKDAYKQNKLYDKQNYKQSSSNDKTITKNILKMQKENEKLIEKLGKNNEVIEGNIERIQRDRENFKTKYPNLKNYKQPQELDTLLLGVWKDSMRLQYQILQQIHDNYDTLRKNTSINKVLYDIQSIEYLLGKNAEFIQFNSYSNNDIIDKVDSLLISFTTHAVAMYSDSIPLELLDKNVMNTLKQGKNYLRGLKADLRLMLAEGKITETESYETYLIHEYLLLLQLAEVTNNRSGYFEDEVTDVLKNHQTLKGLGKISEKQADLKLGKNEFVVERTETEHSRDTKLIEKIQDDSAKWKKEYKVAKSKS
jgi:hypothetical protein